MNAGIILSLLIPLFIVALVILYYRAENYKKSEKIKYDIKLRETRKELGRILSNHSKRIDIRYRNGVDNGREIFYYNVYDGRLNVHYSNGEVKTIKLNDISSFHVYNEYRNEQLSKTEP